MKVLAMLLLIGGAVGFFQAVWFLIDHGVDLESLLAAFVLYSMLELWLHKKGKV